MAMSRKTRLGLILLAIINLSCFAGPFGLEIGMNYDQIKHVSKIEPVSKGNDIYEIVPPKVNPDFEIYLVWISKTEGLYYIKAISKNITTSVYGSEIRSKFTELSESLEKIYGKSESMDILLPGSIWNEPNDWMMGLIKKERYLMALWENAKGSNLPDYITSIGINVSPVDTNTAYITMEYELSNNKKAEEALKAQTDNVF
jgi:hypothetical protein